MSDDLEDDFDFDAEDDLFSDDDFSAKSGLAKLWDESPALKIAAIVVGLIIFYVAYSLFFTDKEEIVNNSRVNRASTVTSVPGEEALDPSFRAAVEAENAERAEEGFRTGQSVIPTPIGGNEARLDVAETQEIPPEEDPLKAWRRTAEAVEITQQEITQDPNFEPELAPILEPFNAPTSFNPNNQFQQQQQQQIAPPPAPVQQFQAIDIDLAQRFAEQMRVIIGTRQPQPSNIITTSFLSSYQKRLNAEAAAAAAAAAAQNVALAGAGIDGSTFGADTAAQNAGFNTTITDTVAAQVLLPAGQIAYAQVLTTVNSDFATPVLAQILSGPLAGARAIGSFQLQGAFLVLTFDRIVKDNLVYTADAFALDASTTLGGVRTSVDTHWISRVVLPAAAEFIEGLGEAIAENTETTVVVDGNTVTSTEPELDLEQELGAGVEAAAEEVSEFLEENERNTITVTLDKGTPIGILFVQSVTNTEVQ